MKAATVKTTRLCARGSPWKAHSKDDLRWGFDDVRHASECASFGKDLSIPFEKVLYAALKDYPLIAMDDEILCGTPRLTGTRIPVYMVLDAVQHSGTLEGALTSYPQLTVEQVKEAVSFASTVLEHPIEYEP